MDKAKIGEIIHTYINPTLQEHKGWVEPEEWKDGVLTLRFRGACAGCDGIRRTMDEFVIPTLKSHVPKIKNVRLNEDISQDLYDLALSLFSKK